MSAKKEEQLVPIRTLGDVDKPSEPYIPTEKTVFVSSFTGKELPGHPTFGTKTDDSTGKHPTWRAGIKKDAEDVVICNSSSDGEGEEVDLQGSMTLILVDIKKNVELLNPFYVMLVVIVVASSIMFLFKATFVFLNASRKLIVSLCNSVSQACYN